MKKLGELGLVGREFQESYERIGEEKLETEMSLVEGRFCLKGIRQPFLFEMKHFCFNELQRNKLKLRYN